MDAFTFDLSPLLGNHAEVWVVGLSLHAHMLLVWSRQKKLTARVVALEKAAAAPKTAVA